GGSIDAGAIGGDLSLHTGGGSIKVGSAKGKISAESGGGSLVVVSGMQEAVLETGGGSIQVERCAGRVKASTGGGSIELGDIGGAVEMETGGGSIRLASAKGAVRAETGGGSIELNGVPSARAETGGGGIVAKFVSSTGERTDSLLETSAGDVTADRLADLKLKEEHGVEVTTVDQDAPAGKAGIKEHDVILNLNGTAVESVEQLRRMIREVPPGRVVTLGISRNGQPLTLKAQL